MALLAEISREGAETLQLELSRPLTKRYLQEHGQTPLKKALARNPMTLSELCSNRAGKGRDGLRSLPPVIE